MGKYTDWKNEPKLEDLKKDYNNSSQSFERQQARLDKFKRIFEDEEKHIIKDKSSYRSKLLMKQLEWVVPNLEEPILSTRSMFSIEPLSSSKMENSHIHKKAIQYQWNTLIDKRAIVNKAARKFAIEGTAIIKVGWELKTEKTKKKVVEIVYADTQEQVDRALSVSKNANDGSYEKLVGLLNSGQQIPIGKKEVEIEEITILKNQPKYEVKNNRSIIVDPSAKGVFEDINFVIDIYETDYSSIVSNKDSYFNLDKIKKYAENERDDVGSEYYRELGIYDKDDFNLQDAARRKLTIYEYWGYWDIDGSGIKKPIVAAWIGDTLVRLEENPFPHKKIPYVFAAFLPIDDEIWGNTNADLIKDDQNGLSTVVRAMQDITKENAVGQEFIDESLFASPEEKYNYAKGRTVYIKPNSDPKNAIFRKSVEPVPSVLFDMSQYYSMDANKSTGVQDFDLNQNKAMRASSGEMMIDDSTTNREEAILGRFASMFEKIGNMTLAMNKEFLLPDSVIDSGVKGKYEKLEDITGLEGMFNVTVKVLTPRKANSMASKIVSLLNSNNQGVPPKILMIYRKKLAELWTMDDVYDEITEEMNREPSEEEKRAQQLQLQDMELSVKLKQIELLYKVKEMENKDSMIEERRHNIEVDAKNLKDKALAELSLAQVDKLEAQTKLFEQEFDMIGSGTKREQDKEDKEYQHLANLEREEVRTEREQQNIKLKDGHQQNKDKLLDYIKDGTLNNQSFDPMGDVFRNIKDKNSYDFLT